MKNKNVIATESKYDENYSHVKGWKVWYSENVGINHQSYRNAHENVDHAKESNEKATSMKRNVDKAANDDKSHKNNVFHDI